MKIYEVEQQCAADYLWYLKVRSEDIMHFHNEDRANITWFTLALIFVSTAGQVTTVVADIVFHICYIA
ncbi:MAG TPA: hypothetical protein VE573_04280 [Nitrososphaeraceae archaeon]|nr:hypothetical protein [Nitrososphaeraceae archaeon]